MIVAPRGFASFGIILVIALIAFGGAWYVFKQNIVIYDERRAVQNTPTVINTTDSAQHIGFRENQSSPQSGGIVIGADDKLEGKVDVTGWMIKNAQTGETFTLRIASDDPILLSRYAGAGPQTEPNVVWIYASGFPAESRLVPDGGTEAPLDSVRYIVSLGLSETPWPYGNTIQLIDSKGVVVDTYEWEISG